MITQLVRLSLVLIGVTFCLTKGSSGEVKKAVSAPVENATNMLVDDVKFNLIKREAIPEAKVGRKKNRQGNTKKAMKMEKRKNKHRNKRRMRKSKQGNKRKYLKNGNRRNKQRNKNGNRKIQKGNKNEIFKNRKGEKRQRIKKRKNKNGPKNKKPGLNRRVRKNRQKNKRGKRMKNRQENPKGNRKYRQQRSCNNVADATGTISGGISTYRKYYNHYKMINRTLQCLKKLKNKSNLTKWIEYKNASEGLKKVTVNGTQCPGNPSLTFKVIETLINLTRCASTNTSENPILEFCNKNQIPDITILEGKIDACITRPSGNPAAFTTYGEWNNGFQVCFQSAPRNCGCYLSMNDNDDVSDNPPYSCKNPTVKSYNPTLKGDDWIDKFNKAAKQACKECIEQIQFCTSMERQACSLTSTCCKSSTDVTRAGAARRMKIKASMMKQLQNMKIH